ncbi:MAG: hypothetical protein ACHQAX_04845 [Gammaproteobacteria bacterium]
MTITTMEVSFMHKPISVFKTLADTYKTISQHFKLFRNGLMIPLILMAFVQMGLIYLLNNISTMKTSSIIFTILGILPLLVFSGTLMFNISSRITINGEIGHRWWKMTETRCLLKAAAIAGYSMLGNIAVSLIFTLIIVTIFITSEEVSMILMRSETVLGLFKLIVYSLIGGYIGARFMIVFPATAIGNIMKVGEAWKTSKGNGWRLMMITYVPIWVSLLITALWIASHESLALQMVIIPITLSIQIFTMTTVAVAYKKLTAE